MNYRLGKRVKHLQTILRQSLDKFIRLVDSRGHFDELELIKSDWEKFLNDEKGIERYDKCIRNFESLIGFGRELSLNLSIERLISRVAEHFAEIDLAEHIIREYSLGGQGNNQLEKLIDKTNGGKTCDFQLRLQGEVICFEAKYTSSISKSSIKAITKGALSQILETNRSIQAGIVWIFTYQFPGKLKEFQDMVKDIKNESQKTFAPYLLLTVQTYKRGVFGDCVVTP